MRQNLTRLLLSRSGNTMKAVYEKFSKNEHKEVVALTDQVLEQDEKNLNAWLLQGAAYTGLGVYEKAYYNLRQAETFKRISTYQQFWRNIYMYDLCMDMAYTMFDQQQLLLETALIHIEAAESLSSYLGDALMAVALARKGDVCVMLGLNIRAEDTYKKARQITKDVSLSLDLDEKLGKLPKQTNIASILKMKATAPAQEDVNNNAKQKRGKNGVSGSALRLKVVASE